MSTTVKVILACVGFLFLMVAGTCGGMYYWFDKNKERLKAEGEAVMAEGEAYGKAHEERECLIASLERLDGCTGGPVETTTCRALAGIFLDRCFPASRKTEGFCEGVPPPGEIVAGATWAVGACDGLGRGGQQPCGQLVSRMVTYCAIRE